MSLSQGVAVDEIVAEPGWRYPGNDIRSVPCGSPEDALRIFEAHTDADLCTFNPHTGALFVKRSTGWQASRQPDPAFFSAHRRGRGDAAYQAHVAALGGSYVRCIVGEAVGTSEPQSIDGALPVVVGTAVPHGATSVGGRATSLIDDVAMLRAELALSGNVRDVVLQAAQQCGVAIDGRPLVEIATACRVQLEGGRRSP